MSENAQNLKALEMRLNNLRADLDAQIISVQKRSRFMVIIFGCLFIFMCIYLSFAYSKIAAFDAPNVMRLVENAVMEKMDAELKTQIATLKSDAPKHMQAIEDQIVDAPTQISRQLQTVVTERLAEHLPKLEAELNDKIAAAIVMAKTKAQEQNLDLKKPEDFKKFLDMVTQSAFSEMTKVVDKVHGEYLGIAGKSGDYLDHLAVGEGLDKRETLQRKLIITFLQLHQLGVDPADPLANKVVIEESKTTAPAPAN
jgi:hypothetical protein